ncbi:MAG TPA: SAM-dependent chlorinase/fluorinase [Blastocatellia bacterium]|nr:SAM-dependent chlorinase/fluorinase [Blastocatellia bacterium]
MITFLTDFGTADYFVPAVKGVILSINPHAVITDITHEVPAHDIEYGAFTLGACWHNFPPGTIHLAVVDPGVGSERRVIIVEAGRHLFVGPDNGIFSYVYAREPEARVHQVTQTSLWRHPVSTTFHGRDVFGPLAAHLSLGARPEMTGPEISDYQRFDLPAPKADGKGTVTASIIHLDHFGNCVTSLTTDELPLTRLRAEPELTIGDQVITRFGTHYSQAVGDELFAYVGSAGYWEVAVRQASAAQRLGAHRGMKVKLSFGQRSQASR